ncbi:hypothetical protein SM0020_12325 [Sinorhizobium meliloti CCNWSX0020]|uniref:Uncharacterized protein n=1 Tax=Sinorhizobium meliloti CCNWSX0020 TaxID=1107881 RepID=H0FZ31_RHIML|nr:hypothetical protein [Sinorhizobium meliloti]EHK77711.1 hypothetical protein SM0020_12325 [Sinorhizobium meliloti CCNWSX0020]
MGVISTAVKHLIAAGVTGDALVSAIEEMESQQVPVSDEPMLSKRQARNKRYYERLKASENRLNKTNKTHSDADFLPPSPCPLGPPSQTLPPIIPQTPSTIRETKRASRLPVDWVLPAMWGRWALDQGHSEAKVRLEADKFRDFWVSKGGKDAAKLDWEATWRNWIRNCSGSRGPPPAVGDDGLARDAQGRVNMADFTSKILEQARQLEDDPNGRTIETSYERGTGNRAQQALPLPRTEER